MTGDCAGRVPGGPRAGGIPHPVGAVSYPPMRPRPSGGRGRARAIHRQAPLTHAAAHESVRNHNSLCLQRYYGGEPVAAATSSVLHSIGVHRPRGEACPLIHIGGRGGYSRGGHQQTLQGLQGHMLIPADLLQASRRALAGRLILASVDTGRPSGVSTAQRRHPVLASCLRSSQTAAQTGRHTHASTMLRVSFSRL